MGRGQVLPSQFNQCQFATARREFRQNSLLVLRQRRQPRLGNKHSKAFRPSRIAFHGRSLANNPLLAQHGRQHGQRRRGRSPQRRGPSPASPSAKRVSTRRSRSCSSAESLPRLFELPFKFAGERGLVSGLCCNHASSASGWTLESALVFGLVSGTTLAVPKDQENHRGFSP